MSINFAKFIHTELSLTTLFKPPRKKEREKKINVKFSILSFVIHRGVKKKNTK